MKSVLQIQNSIENPFKFLKVMNGVAKIQNKRFICFIKVKTNGIVDKFSNCFNSIAQQTSTKRNSILHLPV